LTEERSVTTTRKQYSSKFKALVAIEAIRGEKTLSQMGSKSKVHPIQIAKWRKSALEQLPELFMDGRTSKGEAVKQTATRYTKRVGG
jgi:transposase